MSDVRDDPHSRAADAVAEGRPVEAQFARQGRKGGLILWILVISLTLAALVVFGSWLMHSDEMAATDADIGHEKADARLFNEDEPAPPKQGPDPQNPSPNP